MDVKYYRMREGQEQLVADLILGLIADYGTKFISKLTPESLKASAGFLNVEVAELDGEIIGICAWVMTFSSWRGTRGIYLADHFVTSQASKRGVARELLLFAATNAAELGATFIRTEVDVSDEAAETLYSNIGFWVQPRHMLAFLEADKFAAFVSGPADKLMPHSA